MKSGSADSLKVSVRWGCSAKAPQIRCTALRLRPLACAIDRVLQCVASAGVVSRVRVSTRSTCASVIVRGAPGRGSSRSPSSRRLRNRVRPLPTVCFVSRNSCATTVFVFPAAQPKMRRARWATAWAVFARRAQRSSVSRSVGVTVRGEIGRPVRIGVLPPISRTPDMHKLFHVLPRQDTSGLLNGAWRGIASLDPKYRERAPQRQKDRELHHHAAVCYPSCSGDTLTQVGNAPQEANHKEVSDLKQPNTDEQPRS